MTTKKVNNELAISQQDLNEEGIKTQLNQNDLLEVLVTERLDAIDAECAAITAEYMAIREQAIEQENLMKEQVKKEAIKALKKLGIIFGEDQKLNFSIYVKGDKDRYDVFNVYKKSIIKGHDNVFRERYNHTEVLKTSGVITGYVLIQVKDVLTSEVTSTHEYKVNVSFTYKNKSKEIVERIGKHNDNVDAYTEKMAGVNINYNSVLKNMRVTFNKKLIATGSPNLRKKILECFGLSI